MLLKDLLKSMPEEKFPLYCEFKTNEGYVWHVIITSIGEDHLYGVSWVCHDPRTFYIYEDLVTSDDQYIQFNDIDEVIHWESLNEVGTPIASSCICFGPPSRNCPVNH